MFIFTFHLAGELHNRLSRSGARGEITTVNGISTRSGFRDKKWIFSSTEFTIQAFLFSVLYATPLNRRGMFNCEEAKSEVRGCLHIHTQSVFHTLISENANLHYTSLTWQVKTGCKSFQRELSRLHEAEQIITDAWRAASEHECWDRLGKSFRAGWTSWAWQDWHKGQTQTRTVRDHCEPLKELNIFKELKMKDCCRVRMYFEKVFYKELDLFLIFFTVLEINFLWLWENH